MRTGRFHGAIQLLGKSAIEDVVDQRGFAGAGDSGDDRKQAERQSEVDILQIVGMSAKDLQGLAVGAAALLRNGDREAPLR